MLSHLSPFLLATTLFCTAQTGQAQNMNLDLKPQEDKVLSNSTLWTIHATCQIQAETSSKKTIKIKGVKGGGQVNGKDLGAGKATSLTFSSEKTIEVTAEPGAQVTIINMSTEPFTATCST